MNESGSLIRPDGRTWNALRPVSFDRGFAKFAHGSVLVSFGDTRVLCAATVEDKAPPFLAGTGRGWVTAEYAMLPASAQGRTGRNHIQKGRAQEISRLIGRSLRNVIDLTLLGERTVTVDCDVLQADGGTRTAAITGGYIALHDALSYLRAEGLLDTWPLTGQCAAVSVGVVDGSVRLDLPYAEDSVADVDMNVVMREDGSFVEIQGCAEGMSFSRVQFDAMLGAAEKGCRELIAAQRSLLDG